jgi:hypothetical protein
MAYNIPTRGGRGPSVPFVFVPALGDLVLSGQLIPGTPSSGTILNATTGSTITSNVSGLVVNSAARTYTYNGAGTVGAINNGLVETLAGATFSPRGNVVTLVSASGPVVTPTPTPTLSATVLAGQSQAVRMFGKMPTYDGTNASLGVAISPNAQVLARYTDTNRSVSTAVLGVPADGGPYDSTFVAEYTRQMETLTSKPQLLAGHAVGGSVISQWQPGQQNHTDLLGVLADMPVGFERVIFFLGGTDAGNGTTATAFKAGLSGFFDSLAAQNKPAGTPFQKIVITMGTRLTAGDGTAAQVQTIRKAAAEWCAANNGIYLEPHELVLEDAVHQGQPGSITLARVIARAAVAGADNGPSLVSATRAGARISLTASGALSIAGDPRNRFQVYAKGTTASAIATSALALAANGAGLALDLAADPGDAAELDVYWLRHPDPSGSAAFSNMIRDTYTSDGIATGRQLKPTVNGPVSVAAVSTGTPTPTPTPPQSAFLDTFTAADGTNLTAHTSDSGHTYTAIVGSSTIANNEAYSSTGGGSALFSSYAPASPNYTARVKMRSLSAITNLAAWVLGRASANGTTRTHYQAGYQQAGANGEGIYLGKTVSGTFSVLGFAAFTPTLGVPFTVDLVMNGDQISAVKDGVTVIASLTDSSITAAGTIGMRTGGATGSSTTTGMHFDDLTVV